MWESLPEWPSEVWALLSVVCSHQIHSHMLVAVFVFHFFHLLKRDGRHIWSLSNPWLEKLEQFQSTWFTTRTTEGPTCDCNSDHLKPSKDGTLRPKPEAAFYLSTLSFWCMTVNVTNRIWGLMWRFWGLMQTLWGKELAWDTLFALVDHMIGSWWQCSIAGSAHSHKELGCTQCLDGLNWHLADVTWLHSLCHTSLPWHKLSLCPEYSSHLTSTSEFTCNCSFRRHLKQFYRPLSTLLWHPRQWKVPWIQPMGHPCSHSAHTGVLVMMTPPSWISLERRPHLSPPCWGPQSSANRVTQLFSGWASGWLPGLLHTPTYWTRVGVCHNHACFSKT